MDDAKRIGENGFELAVPVSVVISPLAVSSFPFSAYSVPSANSNVTGGR